jgi:hypothetical protein
MQSLAGSSSRRFAALVALAAAGALALCACIIGPKQDDPAPPGNSLSDTGAGGSIDTSTAEDLEGGKTSDTADIPTPGDTMPVPMSDAAFSDTGCTSDADGGDACATDAAADAVTDAADGG